MGTRFLPTLTPLVIGIGLGALNLSATDWRRWLGPDGSIRTSDPAFRSDLSKYSTAWEAKIGRGYSAVSIADGRAFVHATNSELAALISGDPRKHKRLA